MLGIGVGPWQSILGGTTGAALGGDVGGRHVVADFANNTASLDGVTCTIASLISTFARTAGGAEPWQVNASGVYSQVAAGDRRQTDLGTIIEGARTSIARNNRDLTQATWTKTNVTAAKDQVGIDGVSNSASSITATSANGMVSTTTTGSGNRSGSLFVKRLSGVGTLEVSIDTGTPSYTDITPVGAGWERKRMLAFSGNNPTIRLRVGTSGDAFAIDFVMAENGAVGVSSPFLVGAAAATRNAESFGLLTSIFNLNKGTALCAFNSPTADAAVAMLFCLRTTTPAVVIEEYTSGGSPLNVIRVGTLGGAIALDSASSYVPLGGAAYRAAFAWSDGDSAAAFSTNLGGNLVTDAGAIALAGPITFAGIGNNSGAQQGYAYISYFEYHPTRLADASLQAWASA